MSRRVDDLVAVRLLFPLCFASARTYHRPDWVPDAPVHQGPGDNGVYAGAGRAHTRMGEERVRRRRPMPKMKAYASFADWKKDQSAKNKRLISALQRVIGGAAPLLRTTVKWGQGCWAAEDGDPKVFIHTEEDHVQLGFYRGSSLEDPCELLVGSAKYVRHVKVWTAGDIDATAFAELIAQVAE